MRKVLLEAIVASLDDAISAEAGGADRFELCSALAQGGLTPSLGTVQAIKEKTSVPVMCMVRPREGGMCYSSGEYDAMLRDAELLLDSGADGLVFGFLTATGEVDLKRCREFMKLVEAETSRKIQTCFHRAFDVVANPDVALEQLVDLGVTRILTSGRAPKAIDGLAEIRRYMELADGRIEILPGGEINAENLEQVVSTTGTREVHLYITRGGEDRSVTHNRAIYFGAHVPSSELEIRVVDESDVRRIRRILDTGSERR